MTTLKKDAKCRVHSLDEIGLLSESINGLYSKLLQTIENLEHEKEQVAEAERQKIDFLRMASHELKTPVTALNAILDNMVMGIGKYKDYNTYLPLCKERSEQIATMIELWKVDEFESWMEQERAYYQQLADNGDKSFWYKNADEEYVCREWTQADVDTLYSTWEEQLALMR